MIENNFEDELREESNILKVEIHCITPPNEMQLEKLKEFFLEEYAADDIDFLIKKDPSVVGGFNIFVYSSFRRCTVRPERSPIQ